MGIFDSVGDFIFGEAPDTKISSQATKTPEQQQLLKDIIASLQSNSIQYSPVNDNMRTSLTALENWSNEVFSGGDALTSKEGKAGTAGLQDVMSRGPQDFDKYFTETVEKPLFETFNEDIMPGISGKYAPSGFWSSQRTESEGRAREDLIDTLGRERARTGYQAYSDDLNRILQAGGALTGVGTQAQGLATTGAGMQFDRQREAQRRKEQEMSLMLAALGVNQFENIATVEGGQTGLIPGMVPGFGQGAGYALGGKLFG